MRHVKTILFLGCCFLVGMGLAKGVLKYRAHRVVTHVGDGNAPPLHGFYLPLDKRAAKSLDRFDAAHASAVALCYPASATGSAKILAAAVARAHDLGLKVVLLPPPAFSGRDPYLAPLQTVATEAQSAGVDVLCISWLNADPDAAYWAEQAALVRRSFKGPLILAATPGVVIRIDSAEGIDYLGVIGPVPMARRLPHAPDDVDLEALYAAWACPLDELESVATKIGKPLVLLHMGIASTVRAKLNIPGNLPPTPTADPVLQAMAYEALIYETKGRGAIEGLFLPVDPDPAFNSSIMPRLKALWSESAHGAATAKPPEAAPVPPTQGDDNAVDPL